MTIRAPNGSVEIIDARELAPAAASTNMYAGKHRPAHHDDSSQGPPFALRTVGAHLLSVDTRVEHSPC